MFKSVLERREFRHVSFPIELNFINAEADVWLSAASASVACAFRVALPKPYIAAGVAFAPLVDVLNSELAALGAAPGVASAACCPGQSAVATFPHRVSFERVRASLDPGQLFCNSHVRSVLSIDQDDVD